jgi:tripartite ATP-independent transporter DctP family solute receptor
MKKLITILMVICLVSFSVFANAEKEVATTNEDEYPSMTIGWGTTSSEGTIVVKAMHEFADAISAATDGKVKVDLYPGSQLGSATAMLEQCQLGTLAMTNTQPAILAGIGASEQYVLSMPYVFNSFDARWDILYGQIGKELNDIVTAKCQGLVGFSYFGDGARHFFTNFPVNTVKDLAGKKLRVQKTTLDNAWCTALGAIPTPTDSSEMYSAMSTGLVDGAEQPIANYYSGKYTEVSKYFVLDGHTYNTIGIVFAASVWNSMNKKLQDLITETWDKVIQSNKQVIVDNEAETLKLIEAAGVKVSTPSDINAWKACMSGVYQVYIDQYGQSFADYLKRIQDVK